MDAHDYNMNAELHLYSVEYNVRYRIDDMSKNVSHIDSAWFCFSN